MHLRCQKRKELVVSRQASWTPGRTMVMLWWRVHIEWGFLFRFKSSFAFFLLIFLCVVSLWPYLPLCPLLFPSTPPIPNPPPSGAWPCQGNGDQQHHQQYHQRRRKHPLPAQQHRQCRASTNEPCLSVAGGEPLEQGHHSLQSQRLLYQPVDPEPARHHDHFSRWWGLRRWRAVFKILHP